MTDTAVAEPTAGRGSHSPLRKTVADMVRSMGIVGGIIAIVLVVSWRPQPDPVREIDALPVAAAAAARADFPVLYPTSVPGWRATSARFEPTRESGDDRVWFNGWVTPTGEYVAVVQSRATNKRFLSEQTIDGSPTKAAGPTVAAGFTAYSSADGTQRSFVRQTGALTTVITGTLAWEELAAFTAGLRPVANSSAG
jgi:Protein of unknown function (DUF4245)